MPSPQGEQNYHRGYANGLVLVAKYVKLAHLSEHTVCKITVERVQRYFDFCITYQKAAIESAADLFLPW